MATTPASPARNPHWRRRVAILAAVPLSGLSGVAAPAAFAADLAPVPAGQAAYSGHASGTYLHVNALPVVPLAQVDLAEANAATRSEVAGGLQDVTSLLGRPIAKTDVSKNSSATGDAAYLKLVGTPVSIVAPSASTAAPSSSAVNDLGPVDASPLLTASAVHSTTAARWAPNDCVLGADISYGQGRVANAVVVPSANPLIKTEFRTADGVVDSQSRTRLVTQTKADGTKVGTGRGVGLLARSDVVLAPVTVDLGGGTTLKVVVNGTLRLDAVATGIPGAAYVSLKAPPQASPDDVVLLFAPGAVTPSLEVPLSAILNPLAPVLQPLRDQLAALGVLSLSATRSSGPVGPAPAADGTSASASVDFLQLKILSAAAPLGAPPIQVNIGHAEVSAAVPAGGIECPGIKVTKETNKDPVTVGDAFVYTITTTNPYDCRLTNVKLNDKVSSTPASSAITWTIDAAAGSDAKNDVEVTWNDIGPIEPKKGVLRQMMLTLRGAKAEGKLIDDALVTADCAIGSAQDFDQVLAGATVLSSVSLIGQTHLEAPRVVPETPRSFTPPGKLAHTGIGQDGLLGGAGILVLTSLVGSQIVRRRKRA